MSDVQRDLGAHEAKIEALEREVHGMRGDLAEIKQILAQAKGSWKMLLAISSLSSGLTVAMVKVLAVLKGA